MKIDQLKKELRNTRLQLIDVAFGLHYYNENELTRENAENLILEVSEKLLIIINNL